MDQLTDVFTSAFESRGEEYEKAEAGLVSAGEDARSVIELGLEHEDPVARLLARTLIGRLEGGDDAFVSTEGALEVAEIMSKGSVIGTPSAYTVASGLYSQYQGESAPRAALLLLKREGYEAWKVRALLSYLEMAADPATTEGLLRFAVESEDDGLRARAIEIVGKIEDPNLAERISFERARALELELAFPVGLEALLGDVKEPEASPEPEIEPE